MTRNLIFILFFLSPTLSFSQIGPDTVIINFYKWYQKTIRFDKEIEYQPTLAKDSNGAYTLIKEKYFSNLRKHGFTDNLIEKEDSSYNDCIKHFTKTKGNNQQIKDCLGLNTYRWTHKTLSTDSIVIRKSLKYGMNKQLIIGELYANGNYEKLYSNCFVAIMLLVNNQWKIDILTPSEGCNGYD